VNVTSASAVESTNIGPSSVVLSYICSGLVASRTAGSGTPLSLAVVIKRFTSTVL
jgi:hypothetical protein